MVVELCARTVSSTMRSTEVFTAAPLARNTDDQAMTRRSVNDLVGNSFRETHTPQSVLRPALDRCIRAEVLGLPWVSGHTTKLRSPYDG